MGEGKLLNKTFSSLPTTIFEVDNVIVTKGVVVPSAPGGQQSTSFLGGTGHGHRAHARRS